jgi:hypothetical protein
MRRRHVLHVVLALALLGGPALRAQTPRKPAPAAPAPVAPVARVVLAPLTSLTESSGKLAPTEAVILEGLAGVAGVAVVPPAELRAALKKARRPELESCGGELGCLVEVGKLVRAERVVAGEVSGLGEDQIVYLKVVDVAAARETGSTQAVLPKADADRRLEAKSAAHRLLARNKYQGTLALQVDVQGATVYLDGRKVATSPAPPLLVAVGTHALRVTHEQYRDWVRFVDVKFGETMTLPVGMTAFPIISDEMRGQRLRRPVGPIEPLPWYRRWYTVAGFAGALLISSAIISFAVADRVDADAEITIENPPR